MLYIIEAPSQDQAFVGETGFSVKLVEVLLLDNRTQGDRPAKSAIGGEEPLSEEAIRGRWAADKSRRHSSLDLVEAFTFSDTHQPDSPLSIDGTLSLWQGDHDYLVLSLDVTLNRSAAHLAQQTAANTGE